MFSDDAENDKINVESECASSPDVMTEARQLNRIKSAGDQVDTTNDKVDD